MQKYRSYLFCLAVILLTFSATANATEEKDVTDWLQRMVNAVHTLNYEGTFVFLHEKQLETMKIEHTVDASGEKERLLSLNGVPREVFRDNASVTCISPDMRSVSIGNRMTGLGFRAVFSIEIDELMGLYDFHVLGEQRIADRETVVVAIIPKDEYRYGYRIYLDAENAFPLKSDMMDINGEAVSQIMFTQLSVFPATQQLGEITIDGKEDYAWVQEKPKRVTNKGHANLKWRFVNLPKGFNLSFHSVDSASAETVEHFVMSDGLASLSLYAERSSSEGLLGHSNMGTVNAFGKVYGDYHITAVGEVPAVTVEQVANSITSVQ